MLRWIHEIIRNATSSPKMRRLREIMSEFGPQGVVEYILWAKVKLKRFAVSDIRTRYALHPIGLRWGTTDYYVYRQVFVEREYGCMDDLTNVGLIIDCGANVG